MTKRVNRGGPIRKSAFEILRIILVYEGVYEDKRPSHIFSAGEVDGVRGM